MCDDDQKFQLLIATVCQCGGLQDDLALQKQFYISGTHYSRTLEEWLLRMDAHRSRIFPLFQARPLSCMAQKTRRCSSLACRDRGQDRRAA